MTYEEAMNTLGSDTELRLASREDIDAAIAAIHLHGVKQGVMTQQVRW